MAQNCRSEMKRITSCLDGEVKPCTGVLSGCRKWHSCLTCLFCGALCQFTSHSVTHCGTQETSRDWSLGGFPVETEGKIIPSVIGRFLLGPDILSEQGFDLSPNFPACLSSDLPRCRSLICQKEKNKYHILKHICGIGKNGMKSESDNRSVVSWLFATHGL